MRSRSRRENSARRSNSSGTVGASSSSIVSGDGAGRGQVPCACVTSEFSKRKSLGLELCGGAATAEIATVREDYRSYVCKHFRQNCASGSSTPLTQIGAIGVANYVSPINKAADWLSKIGNQRLEYVDAALAAQRAQVCATCPQNVSWLTPCQPCNDNVRIRTQQAKGSFRTPYDSHLHVCRIFGHMNAVAVWLADTQSAGESQPPAICWKLPS